MADTKKIVYIDSEMMRILGIDPEEAVIYLESKLVTEVNPVHVSALLILRESAVASS